MHVDIKTESVTQLRQTFSHVARHIGGDKPASRYQEATYDLQAQTNFHYRPLWQPEMELYDVRRTKLVMKDWYAFRDPRQYYYGAYTITRSRQQDAMEKNIEFIDKRGLLRGLPDAERQQLVFALVPLRDSNSGESLAQGKTLWLEHPAWQGLRRTVEKMMVTDDCFEVFVAQNLVLDGLLYPLVYQHYERKFSDAHGPALSLLAEFMSSWFDETSRWVDATIKIAAAESEANRELLRGWVAGWRGRVREALGAYAAELFGDGAEAVLAQIDQGFDARLAKLGLGVVEKAA
jgi:phenol hydroxylase P1 protein